MLRARARDPPGAELPPVRDESPQGPGVLVVDVRDLVPAEDADFGSLFLLPGLVLLFAFALPSWLRLPFQRSPPLCGLERGLLWSATGTDLDALAPVPSARLLRLLHLGRRPP